MAKVSNKGEFMKKVKLNSGLEYVQSIGNKADHHIRNSLELEMLMELEEKGLGQWTITQLLNNLQDMYTNGETESYYILAKRATANILTKIYAKDV